MSLKWAAVALILGIALLAIHCKLASLERFLEIESANLKPSYPCLQKVVREMNRLGMIVDLSHVGENTTRAAIRLSRAPVVFTHSSVYSLCNHKRNVPDDIIQSLVCIFTSQNLFDI